MKQFLFTSPIGDRIEARMLTRHADREAVRRHIKEHPSEEEITVVAEDEEKAVAQALKQLEDMYHFPNTLYI